MDKSEENQRNEQADDSTEHVTKKLRINENCEFISAVVDSHDTEEAENKSDDEECVCALCMEGDSEENQLLPSHKCPQCAPDAWKICQFCHESLLSRTCPVCRGDYAPIVMHPVPGLPLNKLADQTLNEEEKTNLLYKFGIIRHLIGKSNVSVWSPKTNRMSFSLPQKIHANTSDEQSFAFVSIAMPREKVTGDIFSFTNKVWDEIENEVETGAVTAGELVELQKAIQSILFVTKDEGHKLYTMLSPEDWQYMLDPSESADTSEALKAIKNTIFKPVLPHIQQIQ